MPGGLARRHGPEDGRGCGGDEHRGAVGLACAPLPESRDVVGAKQDFRSVRVSSSSWETHRCATSVGKRTVVAAKEGIRWGRQQDGLLMMTTIPRQQGASGMMSIGAAAA